MAKKKTNVLKGSNGNLEGTWKLIWELSVEDERNLEDFVIAEDNSELGHEIGAVVAAFYARCIA